ncbi:hypothetical protein [Spongiactinospora sp. TRM90649]|uniref:hypothetical protein n=1 Tax=Spongiactinospora sp. TRM90649 TaxID=3031114 RepID=UPI0023F9D01C|nr:hypothetical protein [Spongiactinospora sp. TRM90649]MDF5751242.1 hypothetical protein [Spongiactinospora sp. TRM90649]
MEPHTLRRFARWATLNADGLIALVLALVVGVFGVFADQMPDGIAESATLLVISLMAVTFLRDRAHLSWRLDRIEELATNSSPASRRRPVTTEDEHLDERFTTLANRLEETFQELEELENAMRARAAMARRLAAEAESNRREAETSREVAERRQEEASAFDLLLQSKVDAVAARVDERSKGTQRRYMLYGVALGAGAAILLDATESLWSFWN